MKLKHLIKDWVLSKHCSDIFSGLPCTLQKYETISETHLTRKPTQAGKFKENSYSHHRHQMLVVLICIQLYQPIKTNLSCRCKPYILTWANWEKLFYILSKTFHARLKIAISCHLIFIIFSMTNNFESRLIPCLWDTDILIVTTKRGGIERSSGVFCPSVIEPINSDPTTQKVRNPKSSWFKSVFEISIIGFTFGWGNCPAPIITRLIFWKETLKAWKHIQN